MIREVNLLDYLPPFLHEYKEIKNTLDAENPEFQIAWNAADRLLKNEFIATADEYGIQRFEKLLKILPYKEDTLETRRSRVQARWFNAIPYVWRVLIEKLVDLCGNGNFILIGDFDHYRIYLETDLEGFGTTETLDYLLETIIPANMVLDVLNRIPAETIGNLVINTGTCIIEHFFITNDGTENSTIYATANLVGGMVEGMYEFTDNDEVTNNDIVSTAMIAAGTLSAVHEFITNDEQNSPEIALAMKHAGGIVDVGAYLVSNDFNETHDLNAEMYSANGTVSAEIIEISVEE